MTKIINNLPPPLLPAEIIFTEESIEFNTIYLPSQSYLLKLIQYFNIMNSSQIIINETLYKVHLFCMHAYIAKKNRKSIETALTIVTIDL